MRRVLGTAILLVILGLLPGPALAESCPSGVRPRKEFRNLTTGEWDSFVLAVRALNSGARPTTYDKVVKTHIDNQAATHGYAPFLPWHRRYLRAFEQALQRINPAVMLPYWNTALDSQFPERSLIFTQGYMGGTGKVVNGRFANWLVSYPTQHYLRRAFDQGDRISSWYSVEMINRIVSTSSTYDAFRRAIEAAPHGSVHVNIGGDMSTMHAPNDPMFWVTEAYWDKVWADWQAAKPTLALSYNGQNRNGSTARLSDTLLPAWSDTVQTVMNTRNLCYYYQEFQRPTP